MQTINIPKTEQALLEQMRRNGGFISESTATNEYPTRIARLFKRGLIFPGSKRAEDAKGNTHFIQGWCISE